MTVDGTCLSHKSLQGIAIATKSILGQSTNAPLLLGFSTPRLRSCFWLMLQMPQASQWISAVVSCHWGMSCSKLLIPSDYN